MPFRLVAQADAEVYQRTSTQKSKGDIITDTDVHVWRMQARASMEKWKEMLTVGMPDIRPLVSIILDY